ncbi:hypothetical protein [Gallintestinimicrobium sp.]|uniref:hypothetical protein n=1 Tax=Gallintestinimicrobium sp. TaxID=2981655 RepID=UPI003992E5C4
MRRKEKMMEKRKKDGCETSRNRQKKETGKRNRIVLLAGAGIVAAALLTGGLMHGCREKIPTMQEVFEAYLEGEDNGLEMLSGLGERKGKSDRYRNPDAGGTVRGWKLL